MSERSTEESPTGNDRARESFIIEAHNIVKRFGGAVAVEDVSIAVPPGEVHGVVGENGAGKSTLMRVISGILTPDRGRVLVDGRPLEVGSARAALEAGISLVHQELSLVPEMTVAENIVLGATPSQAGFIKNRELKRIATDALDEIGVVVDLDEPIVRLSVALRQFVEIARAIARNPRRADSRRANRNTHAGGDRLPPRHVAATRRTWLGHHLHLTSDSGNLPNL